MFYKLSDYGVLKIAGKDAKKFLQGQLTCDLDKILPEQNSFAAHCNPQGRVLSFFNLTLNHDAYFLIMPQVLIPTAISAFQKYAIFFKATLENVSSDFVVGTCINENIFSENIFIRTKINLATVAFELFLATLNSEFLYSSGSWKTFAIEHLIPEIYPETSGKFLPQELKLDALNALSFEKGCYTGQEIIARIHYRGKIKNHLYKFQFHAEIAPQPGEAIFYLKDNQPQKCGEIVMSSSDTMHGLMVCENTHALNQHLFVANHPSKFFDLIGN